MGVKAEAEPFEAYLRILAAKYRRRRFKPGGFYNTAGDMIEMHLEPLPYIAEYVDPHMTLYIVDERRVHGSKRIIGVAISRITLLAQNGFFKPPLVEKGKLDAAGLLFAILLFPDAPHGEDSVGRAKRQRKYFETYIALRGKMIPVENLSNIPNP